MSSWLKGSIATIFAILVAATVARPAIAVVVDPPGRVGRLAWTENQVFFRVDRSEAAVPATVNWPISNGALINTDRDARAEIWVGTTALRLDGISELEVAALDDEKIDLRLNEGSLAVSILDREQAAELRVVTPEGAIRFAAAGRYRVDILVGRSELTTYAGQALIEDGGRLLSITPGQRALLDGGGYRRVERAYRPDRFDDWVARREALSSGSESRRHLPAGMTGYHDLDQHGDWQSHSDYGSIWLPRVVAADWAPYRQGRWAWVAPWGWTWIDAAPWGFAPFHYGRWVMLGKRWAWVPGRHPGRPVYSPAVVGWAGHPGWQAAITVGALPAAGWFPLAPREVYVPPYRHSPTHVQRINIVHVQNIAVIEHAIRRPPNYQYREHSVMPAAVQREHLRGRDQHAPAADFAQRFVAPGREWGADANRREADRRERVADPAGPSVSPAVSTAPAAVNPENRPKLPERVPLGLAPGPSAPPIVAAPGSRGEAPPSRLPERVAGAQALPSESGQHPDRRVIEASRSREGDPRQIPVGVTPPPIRQTANTAPSAVNPENRPKLPEREVPVPVISPPAVMPSPVTGRLPETASSPRPEAPRPVVSEPPRSPAVSGMSPESRREHRDLRREWQRDERRDERQAFAAREHREARVPATQASAPPTAARPDSPPAVGGWEGGRRHERREERREERGPR